MARAWLVVGALAVALLLAGRGALAPPPRALAPPPRALAPRPVPPTSGAQRAAAPPRPPRGAAPPSSAPRPSAPASGERLTIELTGYSYFDNTPPGSAQVCCSVLHSVAGGQGTYDDPITVAVPGDPTSMALRRGTMFYLPTVRRYVIVEDSGASRYALPHLDIWVDGRGGGVDSVDRCMDAITGRVPAELDPPPGRPVLVGPISWDGACRIP
jgi:hypothetical protein